VISDLGYHRNWLHSQLWLLGFRTRNVVVRQNNFSLLLASYRGKLGQAVGYSLDKSSYNNIYLFKVERWWYRCVPILVLKRVIKTTKTSKGIRPKRYTRNVSSNIIKHLLNIIHKDSHLGVPNNILCLIMFPLSMWTVCIYVQWYSSK